MPQKISPYRLAWSYRIGRVFGIDIKVHIIFLALLVFVCLQSIIANASLAAGAWTLFYVGLVFLFVLLHELGHSVAAQKLGIRVIDITLWPLGGMARLAAIPEKPAVELRIALAGPAVNFAVLLATILVAWALEGTAYVDVLMQRAGAVYHRGIADPVSFIIFINAVMGIFNLVPAFPLDGGRILRALAARKLPYLKATALAVKIGKILSLTCLALLLLNGALFSQLSLTLICVFIYWAGSFELRAAQAREFMRGAQHNFEKFFTQGAAGAGFRGFQRKEKWEQPDIIEAEVLSATTEGEETETHNRSPGSDGGYRNLSEEDFQRHKNRFEQEFLKMVEKYGKGES